MLIIILFLICSICIANSNNDINYHHLKKPSTLSKISNKVKDMFYFSYNSYMNYAFPKDELKCLSKKGFNSLGTLGGGEEHKDNDMMLTLIDSLSSLAIFNNKTEFSSAILYLDKYLDFNQDIRVNLFEANIRMLGGLLSAHSLAIDKDLNLIVGYNYNNQLLDLSEKLGKKLLKAFRANSDIPYAWLNLRKGVDNAETRETCLAGVGTLLLEFGLLSYYLQDMTYYNKADKILKTIWSLKSDLNLFGNTLHGETLKWFDSNANIGAGQDSYYEYLLKSYIFFGHSKYLAQFEQSYSAIMKHVYYQGWYLTTNKDNGHTYGLEFDSLSSFWSGLQVLSGDLHHAKQYHTYIMNIWNKMHSLPERFDLQKFQVRKGMDYYPLRPELIESTFYLYQATHDVQYLKHGLQFIADLETYMKNEVGYCSLSSTEYKIKEDYMPSFYLSETLKYLYLLYQQEHFLLQAKGMKYIFTTEGHIFPILKDIHKMFGDNSILYPYSQTIAPYLPYQIHSKLYQKQLQSKICPYYHRITYIHFNKYGQFKLDQKNVLLSPFLQAVIDYYDPLYQTCLKKPDQKKKKKKIDEQISKKISKKKFQKKNFTKKSKRKRRRRFINKKNKETNNQVKTNY